MASASTNPAVKGSAHPIGNEVRKTLELIVGKSDNRRRHARAPSPEYLLSEQANAAQWCRLVVCPGVRS